MAVGEDGGLRMWDFAVRIDRAEGIATAAAASVGERPVAEAGDR